MESPRGGGSVPRTSIPSRLSPLSDRVWSTLWRQRLLAEGKSSHTIRLYERAALAYLSTPVMGERALTTEEIRGWTIIQASERADPEDGRFDAWAMDHAHLAPRSILAMTAGIQHLLRWLGFILPDDAPRPRRPRPVPKILERQEVARLRCAAKQHSAAWVLPWLELTLATGLRISETCGLNLSDIDVEQGRLFVRHGKGGKDRVVLFDAEQTGNLLATYIDGPRNENGLVGNHLALFVNSVGRPLQERTVQRTLKILACTAQIDPARVTPHTLRHQFAVTMLEHGADIVTIQRLLGHSDLNTTRIYLEVTDRSLRRAYDEVRERIRQDALSRA